MRDFINNNKWLIGGVLVLALVVWGYFMFFQGQGGPLLSGTGGKEASPISEELLVTLGNLHTIRLDDALFKNPVFLSLSDFGVTIPPEQVGRRNPFAPVGR